MFDMTVRRFLHSSSAMMNQFEILVAARTDFYFFSRPIHSAALGGLQSHEKNQQAVGKSRPEKQPQSRRTVVDPLTDAAPFATRS
jgi:hypothetical protein